MSSIIDEVAFADQVSALLKGKYARKNLSKHEWNSAFNFAFNEVADKHLVRGEAREALKERIGSELGSRPRKKRVMGEKAPLPFTCFTVTEGNNNTVSFTGAGASFRFIYHKEKVEWVAREGFPATHIINEAERFAKEFFAQSKKSEGTKMLFE